jgi:hypothetical protein
MKLDPEFAFFYNKCGFKSNLTKIQLKTKHDLYDKYLIKHIDNLILNRFSIFCNIL